MVDSVFLEGTGCECDVTLDTWLKDSLPNLPGIVRSVAARQLVLAAREFFERTLAWQATIDNINAKAGDKQYWLSPYDEFSDVISVMAVVFRTDGADPKSGRYLSPLPTRPPAGYTTGIPLGYYAGAGPDAIYLYPTLDSDIDDALDILVALTPKQSVEHLPRIAALKFYDAIMDGFLARVYLHPSKPYSNLAAAAEHRRRFISQIGRYRGEVKGGYVHAQNWRFPGGWGVRRLVGR